MAQKVVIMLRVLPFLVLALCFSAWGSLDTRKLFTQEIAADFKAVEDSLCFGNSDFMESAGKNPYLMVLAAVADKEGSCQGMVGVASAIKTRAIFRPQKTRMSAKKIRTQVRRSVYLHKNNCSGTVFIDGYANLRELCHDHEKTLKRRSLQYNLSLAIKEILPEWRTFFFKGPLSSDAKASKHLLKELQSFYKDLLKGEYPLMLVRTHVTLVTGMSVVRDSEGYIKTVTLHHYDPNIIISSERDIFERTYTFTRDGTVSGRLIWNISPRSTKIGCLFTL